MPHPYQSFQRGSVAALGWILSSASTRSFQLLFNLILVPRSPERKGTFGVSLFKVPVSQGIVNAEGRCKFVKFRIK